MTDATTSADRIAELEAHIAELRTQLGDVRQQLSEAELDQWRGRIDDLELQAHLASLDAKDRLDPIIEQLRNTWLEARDTIASGADTATEVFGALRKGVESAMRDLRGSVGDARDAARS